MRRRAQRLAASGDFGGAIQRYRRALRLAPEDPITHMHMACALAESDDVAAARVAARRAAELAGENAAVHLFAGRVLYDLGDFAEARQQLDLAARLSPENELAAAYGVLNDWAAGDDLAWRRLPPDALPDSTGFLVRWLEQIETALQVPIEPPQSNPHPHPPFRPDRRIPASFRPPRGGGRPCV